MGSLADRCAASGVLGVTFFFASWSASIDRRRKTAFVTTIAHQLAQQREDLQTAISTAIEKNPGVFEKNLHVQMELLVLTPLREVVRQSNGPGLHGTIIIDGLDECEAEQYHDTTSTSTWHNHLRSNAQDQLEILQVLQAASSDPYFPLHILIASRPERVFREFFDLGDNSTTFAQKLDLHRDYNADADITLFLEAKFSFIRRRYNLLPSWPSPTDIQTIVENSSGQFIYAVTVIRFLVESPKAPPDDQLQSILAVKSKATSNPFEPLDLLYFHIMESSPDPVLAALWIRGIEELTEPAYFVNLLFETRPGEAEHLLGNLHSLIRIPLPSDQTTTNYGFYHKSLLDFLSNPDRCGKLYVQKRDVSVFVWDAFVRACMSEFAFAFAAFSEFTESISDVVIMKGAAISIYQA
jgi:hypothetical protein